MKRMIPTIAASTVLIASLQLGVTAPSMAQPEGGRETPTQTECTDYADANVPEPQNWVCVGDILTIVEDPNNPGKSTHAVNVKTKAKTQSDGRSSTDILNEIDPESPSLNDSKPPGRRVGPIARVDDYHAINTHESILWRIDGKRGDVKISFNIGLHNHSGNVTIGWWETTHTPIELQFKLRIRQDRPWMPDLDIFEYEHPDNYNIGYPRINDTIYETRYGVGYEALPYHNEPKKYFWDAYDVYIAPQGSGWVSVIGTFQSDRATCDLNPCKFLE